MFGVNKTLMPLEESKIHLTVVTTIFVKTAHLLATVRSVFPLPTQLYSS